MIEKTTKLGVNRGQPRLWLEGKTLTASGFTRGEKFSAFGVVVAGVPALKLTIDGEGRRTVSGKTTPKGDHPIIDINGGDLLAPFVGKTLKLVGDNGIITLTVEE